MRTDSVALSGQALGEARAVIGSRFGERYTMPKGRIYKTKSRGAQEAHEAIRPTSFGRDPEAMSHVLPRDEGRLYRLIWQRALASQMAAKELETTTAELTTGIYGLRASATRTVFDGFSAVYTEGQDDAAEEVERTLPPLREGDETTVESVAATQHFTEPPPRYTEATLIKALEEHGIGRPSTYAATISTITDRGYVVVKERRLHPEPVGEIVTDLLVGHFGDLVDLEFTARMEEDLDEVANGTKAWVPVVRKFYEPFGALVDLKTTEIQPGDFRTLPSDEVCSEGHPMVIRLGRNGAFLGCSLYPEHKETRPLPGDAGTADSATADGEAAPAMDGVGEVCPECGAEHGGSLPGTADSARSSAATATRSASTSRRPARRRPIRCRSRWPARSATPVTSRLVAPAGPAPSSGAARAIRSATSRRRESRSAPSTTPDGGAVARDGETGAICLACGAAIEIPAGGIVPGTKLPAVRRIPAALARPGAAAAWRWATGRGDARERVGRGRSRPNDAPDGPAHRADARGVTARSGADAALDRFIVALEARDASPNTRRAYRTAVGAYLDWLATRGTDWRAPGRLELRAYLAHLTVGHARSSVAQRLAALRSFYRWCTRTGLTAGDPWGALATPRLPRRLPRVLEVEQVERLLAAVDDEPGSARTRCIDPPRPGDRRDGVCGRAADRRARHGGGRRSGPAPRRDPGHGQGPQGAHRPPRPAGPGGARGVPYRWPPGPGRSGAGPAWSPAAAATAGARPTADRRRSS